MAKKNKLHPSVQQFKAFVQRHPLLIKQVRNQEKSWQDIYEEWVVLGEDNEHWYQFQKQTTAKVNSNNSEDKEEEKSTDSQGTDLSSLLGMLKKVNISDLQQHMSQFSGLLTNVQSIVQAFQGNSNQQQESQHEQRSQGGGDPFSFRRH